MSIRQQMLFILMLLLLKPIFAQELSKTSGFLTFNEHDFPAKILNYPTSINETWRATFKETKNNRMFMHTFRYKIPNGCSISNATLFINVKNLATSYNNDILGFVENGKVLFKTDVWLKKETFKKIKTLSFNLDRLPKIGSILDSLNDGDFSFYIQDDTAVNSVNLIHSLSGNFCGK